MSPSMQRHYLVIDLKSFYASVECVERGLDPMTTNLVVADPERSEKTICLAVSPSMKALGVRNRCRVFEIPKNIKYIMAQPRMQKYIDYSAHIYEIYLRYIAPEDIHIYSIDEAFIDVTPYLNTYRKTPKEMALFLMQRISDEVGVRSTCGIGTNMYLAKIALDITAKHASDFIGILDEDSYRRTLWDHRPMTDFWRIGPGIASHLERMGIYTMGQLAHTSEEKIYKEFGIDGQLLLDHAWGIEPTTIADIKAYKPKTNCLSSGQVLPCDYDYAKAKIVVKEMADQLCLDMVQKGLVTCSMSLYVGYSSVYDYESYKNAISNHGSISWEKPTNADVVIIPKVVALYESIASKDVPIRRLNLSCNDVMGGEAKKIVYQQSLFDESPNTSDQPSEQTVQKNNRMQQTVIEIKNRFGKDAILRGMNFEEGATTRERNHQIGGHKSGN